jgi:uncharacterized protein (TIGR03435 family)
MITLQRRLYGLILRMHPAAFRREFGREMALDFEDVRKDRGFTSVLGDACLSLARQWGLQLLHEPEVEQAASRHPLLAGQYVMISQGHLTAFDFARASVLAALLFGSLGYAGMASRRAAIGFGPTDGGQGAPGRRLSFDNASVQQNVTRSWNQPTFSPSPGPEDPDSKNGGSFSATNQDLSTYILFAYKMPISQHQAVRNQLPDWAQTARFDIHASANSNPTKDEMRVMMQSLLADRFHLAIHTGSGQAQVYFLVLAQQGETGPHLRPHGSQPQCPGAPVDPHDPRSIPTTAGGFPIRCGELLQLSPSVPGDARFAARDVGIASVVDLANEMFSTGQLDRPVVDRTGLAGAFDFNLEFMPTAPAPPASPGGAGPDVMGGPFQEALQKQLGLKLVSAKGQENTFVIDRVEKPSPN